MRMFRLLAYSILGYAIYQVWCGMRGEPAYEPAQAGRDLRRALDEDGGRMMNMTGTGRGTTVTTDDATGASARHVVGRGVMGQV